VHNPAAGDEETLGVTTLRPAEEVKRVVVVGGGVGGLKAAEVAAMRGHDVTLLERGPALGGQVMVAAGAPDHAEWGEMVTHLAGRLARLGVDVRLGTEATPESVRALAPDAVVVATGAEAGPVPFEEDGTRVLDEFTVMGGDEPRDEDVVLLDHGVRFEGSALAETLAARGNRVRWVTPAPMVAAQVDPTTMLPLRRRIAEHGVALTPSRPSSARTRAR
jgi:NADPH-dependent 2,4-dienoyl-CoA reductase/sulfur reductase-like enzyme